MLRDVLGSQLTQEVLNEAYHTFDKVSMLLLKECRPWTEFIAAFKTPQLNFRHLEQRIITNLLHYRSNYVFVFLIVFCLQILLSPYILLTLVLVLSIWLYFLLGYKNSILIGDITIENTGKKIISSVISLILLSLTGYLERVLWSVLIPSFLCFLHMTFRPRSVTSKLHKYDNEAFEKFFNLSATTTNNLNNDDTSKEVDPEDPVTDCEDSRYSEDSKSMRKRNASINVHNTKRK
jgi:hypothetical protein